MLRYVYHYNFIRMRFYIRLLVCSWALIVILSGSNLEGQILRDTLSRRLVKEATDNIYKMNFAGAWRLCNKINSIYPDHPVVFLLKGMVIYWENYPLTTISRSRYDFEELINLCIEKSESPGPENEAEFLLANLCGRGILLLYYDDNDLPSKVFPIGRTTYRKVRRAFSYTSEFSDLYFYTGLYNYYREVYPETHPVYKTIFFLFPKGDRQKGLNELEMAFQKAIFMKAEASSYLSSSYKYFENDFSKASVFSKTLFNNYPTNYVFRARCIEDLLLTKKYDEAEKLILTAKPSQSNRFYKAQLSIFNGIIQEKKYNNYKLAWQEYLAGAEAILHYNNYGSQYASYAYFGLSRICALNNDKQNQKAYYRKALDLTNFKEVNFDD